VAGLDRVIDALEARKALAAPPEVKPADLIPLLEAIKAISDLQPVLEAIRGIKIPEPKETDLQPVLDLINAKNVDLSPVLDAIRAIKMPEIPQMPEPKPTKWRLVHHRDRLGNLIETEAIAE
jgi:hypothetical protein